MSRPPRCALKLPIELFEPILLALLPKSCPRFELPLLRWRRGRDLDFDSYYKRGRHVTRLAKVKIQEDVVKVQNDRLATISSLQSMLRSYLFYKYE